MSTPAGCCSCACISTPTSHIGWKWIQMMTTPLKDRLLPVLTETGTFSISPTPGVSSHIRKSPLLNDSASTAVFLCR